MGSPFYPHHHTELSSNILPGLPSTTTSRRQDQLPCFYAFWTGVPAPTPSEPAPLRCQCACPLSQVLQPDREWVPLFSSHTLGSGSPMPVSLQLASLCCSGKVQDLICIHLQPHPRPPHNLTTEKCQGQLSFTCAFRSGSLTPQSLPYLQLLHPLSLRPALLHSPGLM